MAFWTDDILAAADLSRAHVLNDSKTPSGRVHVGALRGVLIHDAIRRVLADRGVEATFCYGVDDFDPLDELPAGLEDIYRPYLGQPLCNVPAPPGSGATDVAEHYIGEFFDVFADLHVVAEPYRMRDIYRSGRFDDAIDRILRHGDDVRDIYLRVSGSERPPGWLPFQVVCPVCAKVGTTVVTDYDGETVAFHCRPDLVTWAQGCGSSGRASPFSGGGKLPWKLEWTAKWAVLGVTIEGAGKDHTSRGGSRDVAVACLDRIFGLQPPLNVPYEWFLVGGAKMSSSKGVGVSAREVADLLPADVLRFLLMRTRPRSTVDFEPTEDAIVKLFSDFDKCRAEAARDPAGTFGKIYRLATDDAPNYWAPPMALVIALEQLPHVDVDAKVEALKGSALSPDERAHVADRRRVARHWLDRFAGPEEKLELNADLPPGLENLTSGQARFLADLATRLEEVAWNAEAVQDAIFTTARDDEVEPRAAFEAIYLVFFGRRSGPRAGSVLSFLEPEFVRSRLLAAAACRA
ncbi:MAG TPA: lysine--tRNA ligase [Acidimicrobiales bacterium]|nr:lysine--tRNA ligase [Acidimicrobiales bacterium]